MASAVVPAPTTPQPRPEFKVEGLHREWSKIHRDFKHSKVDPVTGKRVRFAMYAGPHGATLGPWHGPKCRRPECLEEA